jgi:hypothetical protein
MGKAERSRNLARRERIAAQQAAAQRAERRRRMLIASGSVAVVLVLVVAILVLKLSQAPAKAGPAASDPALAGLVTDVPPATFDTVGKGTSAGLQAISGQRLLTRDGRPEVLYLGAEYCPYCAAERWVLAAALSRFGTFSSLHFIHSSPDDIYPSTPTLSFYRSTYASSYVDFEPVETEGPIEGQPLQTPSAAQAALMSAWDRPPYVQAGHNDSIPFVDIGGRYLLIGSQYVPSELAGLSWSQVAHAMHNPASAVARDIDGAANIITAAICKETAGQPGGVCTSAGITRAAGSL